MVIPVQAEKCSGRKVRFSLKFEADEDFGVDT